MRKQQMVSKTEVKKIINTNMDILIKELKYLDNSAYEAEQSKASKKTMIELVNELEIG